MKKPRAFITDSFLARVAKSGELATAAARLASSAAKHEPLPRLSTWALVCEEVVDTEYEPPYCERVVAELFRRGITAEELFEMRMFAWETAGWLNFEKMVWDWVSLDESDIKLAIKMQREDGEIDTEEYDRRLAYLNRYC